LPVMALVGMTVTASRIIVAMNTETFFII